MSVKNKTRSFATSIATMLFLTTPQVMAADWPVYFGPNQDGISTEKANPVWPPQGPKLIWKVPLMGYSSFVVSGNKAFTLTGRENQGELRDVCVALDAATGKELWAVDLSKSGRKMSNGGVDKSIGGDGTGPRTTPTVNDGRVYVYSVDMKLFCLDAQTGKELWRVDVIKDHAGAGRVPNQSYGNTVNPVVDGDLVFIGGGGLGQSILAINKVSGQVVWKAGDEKLSWSPPVVTTIHGERQLVFGLQNNVMGISVKDGKTLWSGAMPYGDFNVPHPIVHENKVYAGCAGRGGAVAFEIIKENNGFSAKKIYTTRTGDVPYLSTPVLRDGYLYGGFGRQENKSLRCVEFASGETKWEQKGFGHGWVCIGSVILVGDKLVVLSDVGELVLVDPKPDAYKELARFKAVTGACWSTLAFSNGRIYIRSFEEGACYELSAK